MEVDRRPTVTSTEFHRDYAAPNRPLILTGLDFWRGAEPCAPSLLNRLYGERSLGDLAFGLGGEKVLSAGERATRFGAYLDRFEAGAEERPGDAEPPLPYLRNLDLCSNFPEIAARFTPSDCFGRNLLRLRPEWGHPLARGEIFIGPAGSSYGVFHFDRQFMFVVTYQLHGRKGWWLYPPSESKYCYPMNMNGDWYLHHSEVNPEATDLERFPLFAKARGHRAILEPGEVLFCPASWWHTTRNLTPSISIAVRLCTLANVIPFLRDALHTWLIDALIHRHVRSIHRR